MPSNSVPDLQQLQLGVEDPPSVIEPWLELLADPAISAWAGFLVADLHGCIKDALRVSEDPRLAPYRNERLALGYTPPAFVPTVA